MLLRSRLSMALLLVALTGCGIAPDPGAQAPVRMCAARVFQGMPVYRDDLANGCTRTDGSMLQIPWDLCPGPPATALAHVHFESGDFWGVMGDWWRRSGDLADDPDYREALRVCRGTAAP